MSHSSSNTLVEVPRLAVEGEPRDHRIQLEDAVGMVQRYSERHPDAIRATMFDRSIFDEILGQPGCAEVRMYYAEGADGTQTLVLVGVDAQGNDLYQWIIGDNGMSCPPSCPIGSPFLW